MREFFKTVTIALVISGVILANGPAYSAGMCEGSLTRTFATASYQAVDAKFEKELTESLKEECKGKTCSREGLIKSIRKALPSFEAFKGKSKAYFAVLSILVGTSAVIGGLSVYVGPHYPILAFTIAAFIAPLVTKGVMIAGSPIWEPLHAKLRNSAFGIGDRQGTHAEESRLEDQYQTTNKRLPLTAQAARSVIETHIRRLTSHTDKIRKSIEGAAKKDKELKTNKEYLHAVARMAEIYLRLKRLYPDVDPQSEIVLKAVNVSFELIGGNVRRRFLRDVTDRVLVDLKTVESRIEISPEEIKETLRRWMLIEPFEYQAVPEAARDTVERLLGDYRPENGPKDGKTEVDTTADRQERKAVVDKDVLDHLLTEFSGKIAEKLGEKEILRDRDPRPENPENRFLTYTDYYHPLKIRSGEKELVVKVRVRQYVEQNKETGEYDLSSRNHVYVELKMDSPVYEGVVKKRRVYVPKELLGRFLSGELSTAEAAHIYGLKQNQAAGSVRNPMIADMMNFFDKIRAEAPDYFAKPFVAIAYNRQAFQINLRANDGTEVAIQITVDQNIKHFQYKKNRDKVKEVSVYGEDLRVIEVKVPVQYVSKEGEAQVPGLAEVSELIREVITHRHQAFDADTGKLKNLIVQ